MEQYYNSGNTAFNVVSWSIRRCIILFLLLLPAFAFSQIEVVNKGLPVINQNVDVIIHGNLTHNDSGSISTGSIVNTGNFHITGNWINNNLTGDIFTSGTEGWVHLDSAEYGAAQTIGGTTITHFNNLNLSGSGIKQLNSIDTEIEDTLALNDREFASGDNTVFVTATGTGVITRTNGFVSSTNDGGLSRNTLSTNTYAFPVGSGLGGIRPVDITPISASANTFKVRMANIDATSEGFDRSLKENTIGEINPDFYHRINRTNGASKADITIYYDAAIDGDYDIITQWQNESQWKNTGVVASTSNYGLSGLTKPAFDNFSSTPFALSTDVALTVFVPNVFSPNGDGYNDVLRVRGKGISELQFIIFNRWGQKVFETTDVNKGWDGTYKGERMNLAVFVYVIKGKFKNGEGFDKKGNFTLLR